MKYLALIRIFIGIIMLLIINIWMFNNLEEGYNASMPFEIFGNLRGKEKRGRRPIKLISEFPEKPGSVAICIVGGARSFPMTKYGIPDTIRENIVDALSPHCNKGGHLLHDMGRDKEQQGWEEGEEGNKGEKEEVYHVKCLDKEVGEGDLG